MFIFQNMQRLGAVRSLDDGVSIPLEEVADQSADARLVIRNQNRRHSNPTFIL